MEQNDWMSDRARAEAERRNRVALFDKFVDLALDDVITLEQALTGYVEEITETEPCDAPNS
jgi:hypothetical protein